MTFFRAVVLGGLLALAAPAHADTLIDHINGITPDGHGGIIHFTGMVIGDDGRVTMLLADRDKPPRTNFAINGHGAFVIPGLILNAGRLMRIGLTLVANGHPLNTLPPPRPEDRDIALAAAQQALLAHGITTIADMGESIEDWQTLRRAGDAGRLTIRVVAYADGVQQMALIGGPGPGPWLYDGRLKAQGVWLDADGATSHDGLIALKNNISRAALDHFQVAVTAGKLGNADLAAALADLGQTYAGDRRWLMQTTMPPDDAPDPLGDVAGADGARLIAHSEAPAHDLFAENDLGCLRAGCRADLLMLDDNPADPAPQITMGPAGAPPESAHLKQVWIGGRLAWQAPAAAPAEPAAPLHADPRGTSGGDGR